jgi:hypothetical protein
VNRASDDALATSLISVLDDVVERRDQWLRNLSHADAVLNNVDAALADASDLMIEAKGIASGQIGIGSDEETRRNQAAVIDSMVNQLFAISNRQFQQVHLFGGDATANAPMLELLGGLRYQGQGDGLANDLGLHSPLRITLSGEDAFGALSARVEGNFDLDPPWWARRVWRISTEAGASASPWGRSMSTWEGRTSPSISRRPTPCRT